MRSCRSEAGFSLLEVLVVLVVVAILCSLVFPRFRGMTDRAAAASAMNRLTGDLFLARMVAIRKGESVEIAFDDLSRCPASGRYEVRSLSTGTVIKRADLRAEHPRVCIRMSVTRPFVFDARGLLGPFGNRTVHVVSGAAGDSARLSVLGRVYRF